MILLLSSVSQYTHRPLDAFTAMPSPPSALGLRHLPCVEQNAEKISNNMQLKVKLLAQAWEIEN